ncbi:hypothetical protein [Sphingomonas endolithica]|uniref:hypothetical protein n=1 Tax=Sphingomonas endolithica TaxID=2972485 RepID=UPI0021AE64A8|nr:hypothetical protein [Sphingomonas sp. ZFBP2030]
MIAFAWKMLAWFGVGVVVALSVLIVPLHVAAERKRLDGTTREIVQAERDIRALETEFETRANIAQLERWNGDTLRLASPVAAQYVRDEAALASLDFKAPLGVVGSDVRMAAAIVPSQLSAPTGSVIAPAASPSATATATATATAATAPTAPVRMASVATSAPRVVTSGKASSGRSQPGKSQAVAMLDRKLLSDSVIGGIVSGASAESRAR